MPHARSLLGVFRLICALLTLLLAACGVPPTQRPTLIPPTHTPTEQPPTPLPTPEPAETPTPTPETRPEATPVPATAEPGWIYLAVVQFDPQVGPPDLPGDVEPPGPKTRAYYILQAAEPVTNEWTDGLRKQGVELFGYIPERAFLARMTPQLAATVAASPAVSWVGLYQPGYKISPDLAEATARQPLLVELFADERLEETVAAIGERWPRAERVAPTTLRLRLHVSHLLELAQINGVKWIQPDYERELHNDVAAGVIGVTEALEVGVPLTGAGVVININDTGVDSAHPAFGGRVDFYNWYDGEEGDQHGHGTHTSGSVLGDGALSETVAQGEPGRFKGMAPEAHLVLLEVFDPSTSSGRRNEASPGEAALYQEAARHSAVLSSNSWGYVADFGYDAHAAAVDGAVRDADPNAEGDQPLVIFFSAGNRGHGQEDGTGGLPPTIASPATAKNCITVGASESPRGFNARSDSADQVASFSSRGPTTDLRVKPDLVAPGVYILSTETGDPAHDPDFGGWDNDEYVETGDHYAFWSGTSTSCALVAGAGALIYQYYRDEMGAPPSPALVKGLLINGAVDLGYGYPSFDQGWGRVNLRRSLYGPEGGRMLALDQGDVAPLTTGEEHLREFVVTSPDAPLKVTLVWSDAPAQPMVLFTLVNDLDLLVQAPDGTVYRGNRFDGVRSVADHGPFDRRNNVENVFIERPVPGTYRVIVRAHGVNQNVVTGAVGNYQDFALAVSGDVRW